MSEELDEINDGMDDTIMIEIPPAKFGIITAVTTVINKLVSINETEHKSRHISIAIAELENAMFRLDHVLKYKQEY